jgi:hypothetical protein
MLGQTKDIDGLSDIGTTSRYKNGVRTVTNAACVVVTIEFVWVRCRPKIAKAI